MKNLTVGVSVFGPRPMDDVGPFRNLFPEHVDLALVDSLKGIDAVLLWGGEDISPTLYAEAPISMGGPKEPTFRDLFEFEVCKQAEKEGKPILGVCRGAQFICAFAGGKLVQHVSGHGSGGHDVEVKGKNGVGHQFRVSSSHHQMMFPYDVNHELLGWCPESLSTTYQGLVAGYTLKEKLYKEPEVVYFPDVNGFAVQCHPEWHNNPDGLAFNKWMFDNIREWCFEGMTE